MPSAIIDGIATRYEVTGAGPPLLMYAPAGFDATLDKWATQGVYAKTRLIDHLQEIHLHHLRPARMRPVGRAGRARDLGALRGAG
jgi:hypothetical protein